MLSKDDLTGVYDRGVILERFDSAARENGHLIAVFIDLDNFMRFNEQYGYQAGDEWIKGVVALFAEAFGADDLVGRYGGDEFIAGVISMGLNETFSKAEELRYKIEKEGPSVMVNGVPTQTGCTVSFGVAAYPNNATDVTDLVEKAKLALYRGKEAGGNRVCAYEEKDTLTGLLNYSGGMRALDEALETARGKRQVLSVIMIDIDAFAQINSEFGHRAGDEVIKRLARTITRVFHNHGLLIRSGGDEFMVVLPNEHADAAFLLAEDLRKEVEESEIKVSLGDQHMAMRFKVTGGIASFPSDANDRVDLLRKAHEALYRAKQTGRNRICLPASAQMVTKTSYYTQIQLERLADIARQQDKSEAFLLRQALDELLRKYDNKESN